MAIMPIDFCTIYKYSTSLNSISTCVLFCTSVLLANTDILFSTNISYYFLSTSRMSNSKY